MKEKRIDLNTYWGGSPCGAIISAIIGGGRQISKALSTRCVPGEFLIRLAPSLTLAEQFDQFAHGAVETELKNAAYDHVTCLISEEREAPVWLNQGAGDYMVTLDPLDGSNNMAAGLPVGTIFSIWKNGGSIDGTHPILPASGRDQIAAGYLLYGTTLSLVVAMNGRAAHVILPFDPDDDRGALVVDDHLMCPEKGRIYSVNQGNSSYWSSSQKSLVQWFQSVNENDGRPYSSRYIGTTVADFHRTLMKGGIYMYPGNSRNPQGKLRYLYEIAPLAFILETAGGRAVDGKNPSLDYHPSTIHDKQPVYIGSRRDVDQVLKMMCRK